MAKVTLGGNPINTMGELPKVGSEAPDFKIVLADLSEAKLSDYRGKRVVINIFPSIDTGVCAQSVRIFNKRASEAENTVVLGVSKDLPFALSRFCGAEGIDKVVTASLFRCSTFGEKYGVEMTDGPLAGLEARSIVVVDEQGKVVYNQLVPEIGEEPNYDAALAALK
ncbi:MAG: thiol peroxidase [Bacteroidales bacterium]|uniref:thiol peroxidase n=1 Tax=Porphyromonas sp. TaxID=1924944 RepID=UPI002971E696|nr:thiol peroxidase [Porphyromonas sp.]MDD7437971.1 thiol peroxidase [Bacteroidales bacterium]MDY3066601.1 thiol peroxidase [Porphyromonas sp.]